MCRSSLIAASIVLSAAASAGAQQFPFDKTFPADVAVLDVSTLRGQIDVAGGEPGRVVVRGTATVRIGFNVPVNAVDLARKLAANPPIQRDGKTLRLRSPSDEAELRAVTVAYQIEVAPGTELRAVSDSGAVAVRKMKGPVSVRTQSSSIDLIGVDGSGEVTTRSGAVNIDGVSGGLAVTTSSSGIMLRQLGGNTRIRTQSGAVNAAFTGSGNVEVETGSSAITLRNIRGGLTLVTESGRVKADGVPTAPWNVSTGSGAVEIATTATAFNVDASNRSGTIDVAGAPVKGTVSKRQIAGTIGDGGPLVRVVSRSGSIHITVPGR